MCSEEGGRMAAAGREVRSEGEREGGEEGGIQEQGRRQVKKERQG